jgi:hypothetical protein
VALTVRGLDEVVVVVGDGEEVDMMRGGKGRVLTRGIVEGVMRGVEGGIRRKVRRKGRSRELGLRVREVWSGIGRGRVWVD